MTSDSFLTSLQGTLKKCRSPRDVLSTAASHVGALLLCDEVTIKFLHSGEVIEASWEALHHTNGYHHNQLPDAQQVGGFLPLYISDTGRPTAAPEISRAFARSGVRSVAIANLNSKAESWIRCLYRQGYHRWRTEDKIILSAIGPCIEASLATTTQEKITKKEDLKPLRIPRSETAAAQAGISPQKTKLNLKEPLVDTLAEAKRQYTRLLEYGNFLLVKTDAAFNVIDVIGDSESLLGITPGEFLSDRSVWARFLGTAERRILFQKLSLISASPSELQEEVRIINARTGEEKWILLRAVPTIGADGDLVGWEGYGVDITERRAAQDLLMAQTRRLEALFEVSRSLQFQVDPALITLRGLQALIKATGSSGGFAFLFDPSIGTSELVAAEGLPRDRIEIINSRMHSNTDLFRAIDGKDIVHITDSQEIRALLPEIAGMRSLLLVPLLSEQSQVGVLVLFSKAASTYAESDKDLSKTVSSQIALLSRQAQYYSSEKSDAQSIAALYRLSHELSKYFTPREVAEHAFPVIQEELSCKRIWLGVVNESRTHIAGQAGFGPGLRGAIVRSQIELDLRHDFLDEAIRTRKPVIVPAGQQMQCSGFNRILEKLSLGTFLIVPLVSLGQVVGVLIVEPSIPSLFFAQRKLALLTSMANEIATVILARRFESKMADAEKMRMAGLLASGVAHNFNNVLQAIMGQASLIELQAEKGSATARASKLILDAAQKGGSLVAQLVTFSSRSAFTLKSIGVNQFFMESREFYKSVLGTNILLEMDLEESAPQVSGDPAQLQQVITNMLINARDAIGDKETGFVRVQTRRVRVRSAEVDPELPPGVYVRIDVEDNGRGMDPADRARCFEPFFTTKVSDPSTGIGVTGSGLGLSSAYSIVKRHEGVITVRSTLGEGTVFSVYLPVAEKEAGDSQAGYEASELVRTGGVLGRTKPAEEKRLDVILYSGDEGLASAVRFAAESVGLTAATCGALSRFKSLLKDNEPFQGTLIIDGDEAEISESFIKGDLSTLKAGDSKLFIATNRKLEWESKAGGVANIRIIEKPTGQWSIYSVANTFLRGPKGELRGQIETLVDETSQGVSPKIAVDAHEDTLRESGV